MNQLITEKVIKRLKLFVLACIYIALFDFFYIFWLSETFDYLGFEYNPVSTRFWIVSHFFALLPIFWIKNDLSRPSLIMYWLLYILTYIPTIILPYFIQLNQPIDLVPLTSAIALGMFIIGLGYYIPVLKIRSFEIRSSEINVILFFLSIVLMAYVVFIFRENLRFVALSDIYELREESDEVTKGNAIIGYATMILSYCLLPILMIQGLLNKKTIFFLFGIGGQIVLFMTAGSKVNLFSAIIVVGIYFLLKKRKTRIGESLLTSMSGILALMVLVNELASESIKEIFSIATSILFMRTMSMGGMLTAQYFYFFQDHPTTNYSHVNVVKRFVQYPYGEDSIGRVIGYYFSGNELLNANASMWVTDGIAAKGLLGVILISIFCTFVFWLYDSMSAKHDSFFAALCVIIITLTFLNTSLFTTLLSGGLIFMMLILNVHPEVKLEHLKN